jgi:hypothetical protein
MPPLGEDTWSLVVAPREDWRLIVRNIIHGGDCDVYWEADPDGDESFGVSILIDSLSGSGVSQNNQVDVDGPRGARLRIVNTSGSATDFAATADRIDT